MRRRVHRAARGSHCAAGWVRSKSRPKRLTTVVAGRRRRFALKNRRDRMILTRPGGKNVRSGLFFFLNRLRSFFRYDIWFFRSFVVHARTRSHARVVLRGALSPRRVVFVRNVYWYACAIPDVVDTSLFGRFARTRISRRRRLRD